MAILDNAKTALRISISTTAFDTEVGDLIAAATADLELSGVDPLKTANLDTDPDPLIKRAVLVYVKANFGYDNPDADRLAEAYCMLKAHLTLSAEYTPAGVS